MMMRVLNSSTPMQYVMRTLNKETTVLKKATAYESEMGETRKNTSAKTHSHLSSFGTTRQASRFEGARNTNDSIPITNE
jgi:hypothetical protein